MIEVRGSKYINWAYPDIYDGKDSLTIGLEHVRAADPIRIKYNSERDGWVIEQASIFEWDMDDEKMDSDWKEVAFIQAWGREKK